MLRKQNLNFLSSLVWPQQQDDNFLRHATKYLKIKCITWLIKASCICKGDRWGTDRNYNSSYNDVWPRENDMERVKIKETNVYPTITYGSISSDKGRSWFWEEDTYPVERDLHCNQRSRSSAISSWKVDFEKSRHWCRADLKTGRLHHCHLWNRWPVKYRTKAKNTKEIANALETETISDLKNTHVLRSTDIGDLSADSWHKEIHPVCLSMEDVGDFAISHYLVPRTNTASAQLKCKMRRKRLDNDDAVMIMVKIVMTVMKTTMTVTI